jgi:hypothetical protein
MPSLRVPFVQCIISLSEHATCVFVISIHTMSFHLCHYAHMSELRFRWRREIVDCGYYIRCWALTVLFNMYGRLALLLRKRLEESPKG